MLVDDKGEFRMTLKLTTALPAQAGFIDKLFKRDIAPITFERTLPCFPISSSVSGGLPSPCTPRIGRRAKRLSPPSPRRTEDGQQLLLCCGADAAQQHLPKFRASLHSRGSLLSQRRLFWIANPAP